MHKKLLFVMGSIMTAALAEQTLVIASWNTLNEEFYKRYAAHAPFTRMPFQERTRLFNKVMNSLTETVDIIALQECGSFTLPKSFTNHFACVRSSDGYLITAYKKDRYKLVKTVCRKSSGTGRGKGALITILQQTDSPCLIGVINVHLPFVHTTDARQAQLTDIRAMRRLIMHEASVKYWFVCGDFNMDAQHIKNILPTLSPPDTSVPLETVGYDCPTALGRPGLEHIDYIFYTSNTVAPHTFRTLPSAQHAAATLLTHGIIPAITTDAGRDHPSDHAIIILNCSLL